MSAVKRPARCFSMLAGYFTRSAYARSTVVTTDGKDDRGILFVILFTIFVGVFVWKVMSWLHTLSKKKFNRLDLGDGTTQTESYDENPVPRRLREENTQLRKEAPELERRIRLLRDGLARS